MIPFYVHPTASVSPMATIRPGAWIGPNVYIADGAVIGHYSVIGAPPEHSAFFDDINGERTCGVHIGYGVRVFEFVSVQAGTERATSLLEGSAVFQHSHVSHDCVVGVGATVCGRSSLAGFVDVGEKAMVGAHAIIHQHCVLGAYSMLGMGSVLRAHINPGQLWVGYPARLVGVNEVGLARAHLSLDDVNNKYFSAFEERVRGSKL